MVFDGKTKSFSFLLSKILRSQVTLSQVLCHLVVYLQPHTIQLSHPLFKVVS